MRIVLPARPLNINVGQRKGTLLHFWGNRAGIHCKCFLWRKRDGKGGLSLSPRAMVHQGPRTSKVIPCGESEQLERTEPANGIKSQSRNGWKSHSCRLFWVRIPTDKALYHYRVTTEKCGLRLHFVGFPLCLFPRCWSNCTSLAPAHAEWGRYRNILIQVNKIYVNGESQTGLFNANYTVL